MELLQYDVHCRHVFSMSESGHMTFDSIHTKTDYVFDFCFNLLLPSIIILHSCMPPKPWFP